MNNLKKAAAVTLVTLGVLASGAGVAAADAGSGADGAATLSPSVGSGDSVNVGDVLNPALANSSVNG